MKFERDYFKDSTVSNYRDYETEKEYSKLVEELIEILNLKKCHHILDFGCATGILLKEFHARGFKNIGGTDVSYWAISEGKKHNEIGQHLFYYNLDILGWYFDYVFFFDVLEHINEIELKHIVSLLNAPNIVVKIPVSKNEGEPFVLEVSRKDISHIQCHSKDWWIEFFKSVGYSFANTIRGKYIYDSEGLFSAHFIREKELAPVHKNVSQIGQKISIVAAVYVRHANYGLRDFLEKTGNQVDKVWLIYDGVENMENIKKLHSSDLQIFQYQDLVGRGKAFNKAIEASKAKSDLPDSLVFIDFDYSENIDYLPNLLLPTKTQDVDVTIGSRFLGHMPPNMKMANAIVNQAVTAFIRLRYKFACTDCLSRHLVISKKVLQEIEFETSQFGWTINIIKQTAKKRLRYLEVGISSYSSNLNIIEKVFALRDILKVLLFG